MLRLSVASTNASTTSCAYKRDADNCSAYCANTEDINVQTFIGTKLLSSRAAQPAAKPFEIYDSRLSGFTLRVQPTGVRSYYARFGRSRRIALGKVGTLLPGSDVSRYWAMWRTAVTQCTASAAMA
jgi:hypothetical protein